MLTDTEITAAMRQDLAAELADLTPPPGLITAVRTRHARWLLKRRAAAAALFTATGVVAAVLVAAVISPAPFPVTHRASAASGAASHSNAPAASEINLDGYAISLAGPWRVMVNPDSKTIVVSSLAPSAGFRTIRLRMAVADGPLPAGAVRISRSPQLVYLVATPGELSLYVPLPAGAADRWLLLVGTGVTQASLVALAPMIALSRWATPPPLGRSRAHAGEPRRGPASLRG